MASLDDMPTDTQISLLETELPATVVEAIPALQIEPTKPIRQAKPNEATPAVNEAPAIATEEAGMLVGDSTAPLCYNCGNQTQRAGSCYVCSSCGSTTGCS
jgi:hypothetical protein